MRTLAKVLVLAFGLYTAKSEDEIVTNNTSIEAGTNVTCTLSVEQRFDSDVGSPPICYVRLTNSADSTVQGLRLSSEKLFAINLVDTNGQPVKKTEYGKEFGQQLTQEECRKRCGGRRYTGAWFFIPFYPNVQHWTDIGWFSLPKAFELTQAGEYTLHLRMRLIQTGVSDSSGTLRTNIFNWPYLAPKSKSIYFQSIWLPEVTAKIRIRPEDIPPTDLTPAGRTNFPAK